MKYDRITTEIEADLQDHLSFIYDSETADHFLGKIETLLQKYGFKPADATDDRDVWSHEDSILITYGDMVQPEPGEPVSKLNKLHYFLKKHVHGLITSVHLLPFFPSTSDDGFSVVDYKRVDDRLGGWNDIENMSSDFRLMADLVINHTSRHSDWFQAFLNRTSPYHDYFIEVRAGSDLQHVTRPRSSPLLTPVHTKKGEKFVWTTFSDDQIDLDFSNPRVLYEFLDIFFFYISKGIKIIRLDAVAYIWKEKNTSCIHLPETHEIVKLFRTLVDYYAPDVTLITETNVPHKENISYFGDGDEAHMVYQFSLPPLLLHAILNENASHLTKWASSMTSLPEKCTFFNFTSSHDGIGVRPLEGLIPDEEFEELIEGIKKRGGFVSYKQNPDGTNSPYELNITYFDAFSSLEGSNALQERRFMCSQIIAMSLLGVPGIYFHNLTATRNNLKGVSITGRYRSINRKKWIYEDLVDGLSDPDTTTHMIFNRYRQIINLRKKHPAFHPMGSQKIYNIGPDYFCLLRQDPDNTERILVICNVTNKPVQLNLNQTDLPVNPDKNYSDIISAQERIRKGKATLLPFDVLWIVLE
ncbi:MAG TPA: sugar phosphorylase [Balneolaceae bacterium]|nr:sugar phosphorylase [Balneolaceae bacterium]